MKTTLRKVTKGLQIAIPIITVVAVLAIMTAIRDTEKVLRRISRK